LLWQLGDLGQHGDLGVGQLPIIANGMVYLAASLTAGNVSGLVLALDARTGRERWRTALDQYDDVYMSLAGPMLYVGGSSAYALRSSDGHIVWRYGSGSGVQFYQPVAAAGVVFIGSTDLGSFNFHPFGIGSSDFLNALDARTGARYWRTPTADIECMPLISSI
jgi:outer membrane protein assembly factor BamB